MKNISLRFRNLYDSFPSIRKPNQAEIRKRLILQSKKTEEMIRKMSQKLLRCRCLSDLFYFSGHSNEWAWSLWMRAIGD